MTDRPPTHIVFLIGALDVGGTERQLVALAAGLDRALFRPTVYCLSAPGPLAEEARAQGVEVLSAGFRAVRPWQCLRILRRAWRMFRDLKELEPQILHAFLFHAYVTGAFLSRGIGARAFISSRRSLGRFKEGRPIALALERLANRHADLFVANSEAVRRDTIAQENLSGDRICVIHNGVQVPAPDDRSRLSTRQQLDIAPDATVVLVVANFIEYKGHEAFIQAWRTVASVHTDAVALLVGEGPTRDRIQQLAGDLHAQGAVRFLGQRCDISRLLDASDLLVHPSEQEGFSNAILEAMAASRPVIATDVGGNSEAVVPGVTGLLIAPKNPPALAAAIERLISSPTEMTEMGRAARARVIACFSMEKMIRAYERLYLKLLAGRDAASLAATEVARG